MAEVKRFETHSRNQEIKLQDRYVDTRSFSKKVSDWCAASPSILNILLFVMFITVAIVPFASDIMMIIFSLLFLYVMSKANTRKLSFQTPMSSGKLATNGKREYYNELGDEYKGMFYMGNDIEAQFNNEELWFSDSDVRTHMLLFGTTGAGKSEALLSLCFMTMLTCSGLIYVDGKGTFELYFKTYATCRALGQEDDLLLMSFLTGDEDIRKSTTYRISNTLNPFAEASDDAASNLLTSLMSDGSGDGMWKDRATSLMSSVMAYLCYRRDVHKQLISVNSIREAIILRNIYNVWNEGKKTKDPNSDAYLPNHILESLYGYLVSIPGFSENKPFDELPPEVSTQHGFLQMQFTKLLGSLADMYGYIFNTQLSEINFWDVVTSRRIMIVLLPALAKSKNELSMLGKIIIACLKQMMASGLGKRSEGNTAQILDVNPTKSFSPFLAILDEYGYYAVQGSAVMPAQARGLGFFMVFAGQDYAAFSGPSKEEAESIVANCKIQIFMALQDEKQTFAIARDKMGSGEVYVSNSKEYQDNNALRNSKNVALEKRERVTFRDLAGQKNGEAHICFEEKVVRARMYYVGIDTKKKEIRVNQFIKVTPPDIETVNSILSSFNEIKDKITSLQFMTNLNDELAQENNVSDKVIDEISTLFNEYRQEQNDSPLLASCATIAHILYERNKKLEEEREKRELLNESSFQTSWAKDDKVFEEQQKQYEKDKNNVNVKEVKPVGMKKSEMQEKIAKSSLMVNNNNTAVAHDVDSTISDINQLNYPHNSIEIKSEKEVLEIIKDLEEKLEEEIEEMAET